MSQISANEVQKTADLARLELSDEEVTQLARELGAILNYMKLLDRLDVGDVPPTTHAVPLNLPLREDVLAEHLSVEDALADAPKRQDGLFEVPKIIEVAE
jgi:aspartyl-tRNA(Asn)/glutamyl-tRNA(Gln) amidotransferase subunit C